jgi:hypothetical protein
MTIMRGTRIVHTLVLVLPSCLTAVTNYDYSRSTAENYARADARLRREFFTSRIGLDYRWHVRYTHDRQALQDEIIRSMLSFEDMQRVVTSTKHSKWLRRARGARKLLRPQQPWCIFTAGCMGAGKTHIMTKLDEHGVLPLPRFVRIDMDRIRALLPETAGYIAIDKQLGGQMTQREAGTIAEILTEEALSRGLNVWVDSSMQDVQWWTSELNRIKRESRLGPAHPECCRPPFHATLSRRTVSSTARVARHLPSQDLHPLRHRNLGRRPSQSTTPRRADWASDPLACPKRRVQPRAIYCEEALAARGRVH